MGNDAINNKVANDVSLIQRNTQSLKDSFKDFKPKEFQKLDGLSKPGDKGLEDLGKDILDKLNIIVKALDSDNKENKKDNASSLKNGLQDILGAATEGAGVDNSSKEDNPLSGLKKGKEAQTPTGKVDVKDLKSLSETNGLGFAVLYWKLDEISQKLAGKDGGDEKKKGGGLGKFFTGLIEGAAGIGLIAVALMAFAGALMIFSFVDWFPALAGLGLFALFTVGILSIAKKVGKEEKSLVDFAKASMTMAVSIGVFALSLYIAGAIFDSKGVNLGFVTLPPINLLGALAATGLFLLFILALSGVSALASKSNGNFNDFAKASMTMALSLMVFSVALYVAGAIVGGHIDIFGFSLTVDLPNALIGTGIFLVFLVALAGIAILAGNAKGDFQKFAVSSLILIGALVAFTLSLVVVSSVISGQSIFGMPPVNIGSAIGGVAFFAIFLVAMVGIAILANSFAGNIVLFGVTAMLLAISVGLFAISMALVGLIVTGEGGNCGGIEIPKIAGGWASVAIGLGIFTIFLLAMIGVSVLAGVAIAFVAPGAVGMMMIAGAVLLMSKAMTSAANSVRGGSVYDENGVEHTVEPITEKEIDAFFNTFGLFIDGFLHLNFIKLMGAMANAVVLTPTAAAIALMSTALSSAAKASSEIVEYGGIEEVMKVFMYFDVMVQQISRLNFIQLAKTVAKAAVLTPTALCISAIAQTLVDASKASQEVQDNGGIQNVLTLFSKEDGFLRVVDELAQVANTMDAEGAVVFAIVTRSMVPIVDSIAALVGIIDDAARFAPGQPDADKVPLANQSINRLMLGDDGKSGFVEIFNSIATGVKSVSGKALQVLPQLKPVTEAIVSLVSVVGTTSEIDQGQIESGLAKVQGVTNFIVSTAVQFESVKSALKDKAMKKNVDMLEGRDKYEGSGIKDLLHSLQSTADEISKINLAGNEMANAMGIVNIINSFGKFNNNSIGNFTKLGKELKSFNSKDFTNANNSLNGLNASLSNITSIVSSANPFNKLKDSIMGKDGVKSAVDTLNDALQTTIDNLSEISKDSKAIQNAMNNLGKKSFSSMTSGDSFGSSESSAIEDILVEWNKNGVPVKATNKVAVNSKKPVQEVAFSI